jgi:hypothetical protein
MFTFGAGLAGAGFAAGAFSAAGAAGFAGAAPLVCAAAVIQHRATISNAHTKYFLMCFLSFTSLNYGFAGPYRLEGMSYAAF